MSEQCINFTAVVPFPPFFFFARFAALACLRLLFTSRFPPASQVPPASQSQVPQQSQQPQPSRCSHFTFPLDCTNKRTANAGKLLLCGKMSNAASNKLPAAPQNHKNQKLMRYRINCRGGNAHVHHIARLDERLARVCQLVLL